MTCRCDDAGCALPVPPPAGNPRDLRPEDVPGVAPLDRYELVADW